MELKWYVIAKDAEDAGAKAAAVAATRGGTVKSVERLPQPRTRAQLSRLTHLLVIEVPDAGAKENPAPEAGPAMETELAATGFGPEPGLQPAIPAAPDPPQLARSAPPVEEAEPTAAPAEAPKEVKKTRSRKKKGTADSP